MTDSEYLRDVARRDVPPGSAAERLRAIADRIEAAERDAERFRMVLAIAVVDDLACLMGNPDISSKEDFIVAIDAATKAKP